jgi:hypothetical protein
MVVPEGMLKQKEVPKRNVVITWVHCLAIASILLTLSMSVMSLFPSIGGVELYLFSLPWYVLLLLAAIFVFLIRQLKIPKNALRPTGNEYIIR